MTPKLDNKIQSAPANGPLVSVIMNCYNGEKYLREAIDSVYAQTYKNWEIIFWDNASTDASGKIAQSYSERLRYFRGDETLPLYAARNMAVKQCRGQAIAFLDCDDIWAPGKLELQISYFASGVPFVFGGYQNIDGDGRLGGSTQSECASGYITGKLLNKNLISIGCVLADAKLIKENLFDDFYELLGDFDLWIRLSIGHRFECVPTVLEYSRQHDGNISNVKKRLWLQERRHFYRMFIKRFSPFTYPEILAYIIKTEIKGVFGAR